MATGPFFEVDLVRTSVARPAPGRIDININPGAVAK